MADIRRFPFERGRAPQRLDHFLAECLPEETRSRLRRLIDEQQVLCNDQPAKAGVKLKGGEIIAVQIPQPVAIEAAAEAIPLKVLYEDPYLIVLDKPAGMVVHPAPGHSDGTLVNALLHHCTDLSGIGGALRPGIVHRLDRDTSGVMVATKDDATHHHLAAQFRDHSIARRYVALVHGNVQCATGTIDKAIGRHPQERKKMSGATRHGRRAVTHWKVLQRFDRDKLTLMELTLETGRTHQIRVHLSEMNLPVVGDPVYGGTKRSNAIGDSQLRSLIQRLKRQALHARLLGFQHPHNDTYLEFTSPLPEDLTEILHYLNHKYDTTLPAELSAKDES
jgi:23S rRNA pseudouridine1911/1915/1917 synthase